MTMHSQCCICISNHIQGYIPESKHHTDFHTSFQSITMYLPDSKHHTDFHTSFQGSVI